MEEYLKQVDVMDMFRQPCQGKRVELIRLQVVKDGSALYGLKRFAGPKEAAEMMKPLLSVADREMFLVMSVSTKMEPLAIEIVAVGTISACLVEMREVFKHAILNNAAHIVCFHNHPSGDPEPSREDHLMTKKLRKAGDLLGISLMDHIIVAGDQYYSFKQDDNLKSA